jgi:hypothetical protein
LDARSGWVQVVIAISLWAIGAHARELRSILAGSAIATRCRRIQIVVRFAKNAADAAVGPERASDIHRPNIIRRVVVDAVSLYGILDVRNIPNVTSSRGANSVCDRSGKIARSTVETTRRWPPVVVVFSTSAVDALDLASITIPSYVAVLTCCCWVFVMIKPTGNTLIAFAEE